VSKYEGRLQQEVERSFNKHERSGTHLCDFLAYGPQNKFMHISTRKLWPKETINDCLPKVAMVNRNGELKVNSAGNPVLINPASWLTQNRLISSMTWAPGLPMLVYDKVVVADVGWSYALGKVTFNQYLPPEPEEGDPRKATPWVKLARKLWGRYALRVIRWFACRVQHPEIKINHCILFGGMQNIGKDTLIEGLRQAVGEWNCREIAPQDLFEKFTGFAKSIILRISEARELDKSHYAFYNKLKVYCVTPPATLPVNEKYINQYEIINVCGPLLTTNHREAGLFLPPDDRRTLALWSNRKPSDFLEKDFQPREFQPITPKPTYWSWIYTWYENGGYAHVAAYLKTLDISRFNPKEEPPKIEAFWTLVDANQEAEGSEIRDIIEMMRRPRVLTINHFLIQEIGDGMKDWLRNPKNRRAIWRSLHDADYVYVKNPGEKDGRWKIGGKNQSVYGRVDLSPKDQFAAVHHIYRQLGS
jgi:hypothetical protein